LKLPIIFDNDCLSSFLWIKRLDIINALFSNQIYIPQTVYDELDKIKSPKYRFVFNDLKTQILKGNFYLGNIMISSKESGEYLYLISMKNPKRIGKGEAAAIVIAKSLNGTLASNNLRDILPHVQNGKPPYICTEDILYLSYQKKHISLNEACQIWNDMKSKRRMLPKYNFKEVIRRFKINSNEKYGNK
jgi:predicted nucleic acid-binding protein